MRERHCRYCGQNAEGHLEDRSCPDGSGRGFTVQVKRPDSASNSFPDAELAAVQELLRRARMNGELRVLLRSPALANFERKVVAMRVAIASRKAPR